MKRLLVVLSMFALALGALATQSCEDTSEHYQHGYYNRAYYPSDPAYHPSDPAYYPSERDYYPSDRPSIDVRF
jgi:ABC-type oligopeptide transport system substrate-binding subunit